jgi:hypothetical protein
LGVVLALYAGSRIAVDLTRSTFRTADLFANGQHPAIQDNGALAALLSFDGDVLSDRAAIKARQAFEPSSSAKTARLEVNRDAQNAVTAALSIGPINSAMWLVLGQLKARASEPAVAQLKMSYLTGPLSADALASRIREVVTTPAADDEEIRVLGQSDIRTLLTRHQGYEPALVASYQQATAPGRKFILDTTAIVAPKTNAVLRRSN